MRSSWRAAAKSPDRCPGRRTSTTWQKCCPGQEAVGARMPLRRRPLCSDQETSGSSVTARHPAQVHPRFTPQGNPAGSEPAEADRDHPPPEGLLWYVRLTRPETLKQQGFQIRGCQSPICRETTSSSIVSVSLRTARRSGSSASWPRPRSSSRRISSAYLPARQAGTCLSSGFPAGRR